MTDVAALARLRERLHQDHASSRPLSSGYEVVGLRGEEEFSRLTGLPLDTALRAGGDGGHDFVATPPRPWLPFTIDVKTARRPGNLIVECGKVRSDTYVLAGYDDKDDAVSFLGWELGPRIAERPIKDFGYGVLNHYLPARALRSMDRLLAFIGDGE